MKLNQNQKMYLEKIISLASEHNLSDDEVIDCFKTMYPRKLKIIIKKLAQAKFFLKVSEANEYSKEVGGRDIIPSQNGFLVKYYEELR